MRKKIISHKYKILIPYHNLQLLFICWCDDYILLSTSFQCLVFLCSSPYFTGPPIPVAKRNKDLKKQSIRQNILMYYHTSYVVLLQSLEQ